MLLRIGWVHLVCISALAASAWAGEPDNAKTKARDAYRIASQHYKLAEYKEALAGFKETYRLAEEPALLFNIAQCHRMMNERAEAIRFFKNYLNDAHNAPNIKEVRDIIARLEKEIEDERTSRSAPPSGLAPPRTEPPPAPVPPAGPVTPTQAGRPAFPSRSLKIAGLTLLGAGVASLILGGAFAGLASSAADTASSPPNGVFDPSAEDRMNLYQNLDVAFFVTGGVLAAGGLTAFLVGQLHRNLEITPTAGPGRTGASLKVEF